MLQTLATLDKCAGIVRCSHTGYPGWFRAKKYFKALRQACSAHSPSATLRPGRNSMSKGTCACMWGFLLHAACGASCCMQHRRDTEDTVTERPAPVMVRVTAWHCSQSGTVTAPVVAHPRMLKPACRCRCHWSTDAAQLRERRKRDAAGSHLNRQQLVVLQKAVGVALGERDAHASGADAACSGEGTAKCGCEDC
eukprot:353888-Chlamydomonas_euryale.AAC.2